MKTFTFILSTLATAILLSSCARQNHLELVGHYKHKQENIQKLATNAKHSEVEMSVMQSEDNGQLVASSGDATPDLRLLNPETQSKFSSDNISEKKLVKVEKILTRAASKNEKTSVGISKQNLKNDVTLTSGKRSSAGAVGLVLLIIFAILLPPLAVALARGIGWPFWLDLILTLCFWIPGVIYAFIVILGGGGSSN